MFLYSPQEKNDIVFTYNKFVLRQFDKYFRLPKMCKLYIRVVVVAQSFLTQNNNIGTPTLYKI